MFIVPIFMPTVFHNGNPSTKMIYRAKIHKNNLNQIANVTKRARLPTFVLSIVDNFMSKCSSIKWNTIKMVAAIIHVPL